MPGAPLRDRVRAALGPSLAATRPREEPKPLPPLDTILKGEWIETPDGPAFVRDEWFPRDHAHGRFAIGGALERPDALAAIAGGQTVRNPAFLDIETTGLAVGTGTLAFIVGVGAFFAEGFRVRQYFLADVARERAMLRLLAGDLACAEADALVTFNGRGFDAPVLETRFTLNRLPSPLDLPHADLLHPARRLYRYRLESRRLIEIEDRVLGFSREDDAPGWMMPQLYFDYLRAGRVAPLRLALRHNVWDVLAMASLMTKFAAVLDGDTDDARERLGLARWRERDGDRDRAVEDYEGALPELRGPERPEALRRLALLHRRARRWRDALALWRELAESGDAAAWVEVAKHLEHRERDYAAALAACARASEAGAQPALDLRIARLRRKLTSVSP